MPLVLLSPLPFSLASFSAGLWQSMFSSGMQGSLPCNISLSENLFPVQLSSTTRRTRRCGYGSQTLHKATSCDYAENVLTIWNVTEIERRDVLAQAESAFWSCLTTTSLLNRTSCTGPLFQMRPSLVLVQKELVAFGVAISSSDRLQELLEPIPDSSSQEAEVFANGRPASLGRGPHYQL